ncbi:MAG: efflux RND transporter periplasmic adaptor subunit [bacterium]|nr:efflux RND transporter periplasmic adaptor subunit [bacterium]
MLAFIKERRFLILIAVAIAMVIFVAIKVKSNGKIETTSPVVGDLVRTVKISGKVTPQESVELGFEIAGIVTSVLRQVGQTVRRGDLLARIDTSGISADILKAEAELALAQAELDKLGGAGIYEAQIDNAKQALIQTIVDTYAAAEDAVYNKTDQFFSDPDSSRPDITPTFGGNPNLRNSINNGRVLVGGALDTWDSLVSGLNTSTYTETHLSQSKKYLAQISAFIADVSRAVSLFEAGVFSQATIDAYKADTTSARNNLNSASQSLIAVEEKLRGLLLEVPVQVARVESARASLLNDRSRLSKTALTSPINGVISRQEAKIGQVVSPNTSLISIISKKFEIEAFVPEVLISGVRVGNSASATLDAYGGQEIFVAKIAHIDPAETIRDGVSTYKIKLTFTDLDDRIKSGMTANIEIETFRKSAVRLIRERAVLIEGNEAFVYVLSENNEREKISVEIGERDSMGNVELISDLPQETKLIINPTEN